MLDYNDYGGDFSLYPSKGVEIFSRGVFSVLIIQNIALFVSVFLMLVMGTAGFVEVGDWKFYLFRLSLWLDVFGFSLMMILSLFFIGSKINLKAWVLVFIGSLIFVLGSFSWRAIADFYPENPLSSFLSSIFMSDIHNTGGFDFSDLNRIHRGFLISNSGLLLFAIGLYLFIPKEEKGIRLLVLFYGVLNLLIVFTVIFIPLKPLVTIPLILYPYWVFVSNPWFE